MMSYLKHLQLADCTLSLHLLLHGTWEELHSTLPCTATWYQAAVACSKFR
jgi:hypothetical protein